VESWRRNPAVFWVLSVPAGAWLVVFFLVPLGLVWAISFGEREGIVEINVTGTLANYVRAFDPLYLSIFWKSIWISTLTTVLCLAVAFPMAFGIAFAKDRWKPLLLMLVILPFWINLLIRTYALIAVFRTRGFVNFGLEWMWEQANGVLNVVGLGHLQLLGERFEPVVLLYNNFAVVAGLVYVFMPFMVLPLYATIERLDRSFLEASLDLGAGQIRTFFSVVVPLTKPGIVSGVILVFIPCLGSFLTPDLLGGTNAQMIGNVIERQFKAANDWPFGAALSFILMYATFGALALRSILGGREAGRDV
jgi:spermidine/putrescine transport system permease protein